MKEPFEQIIRNFQQQHTIYQSMAEMAQAQFQCLEGPDESLPAAELNDLLHQRVALLQQIDDLNNENKILQDQIITSLGINSFVLKELENKVDGATFQKLQSAIITLGKLLERISHIDQISQRHLTDRLKARERAASSKAGNGRAHKAYEEAMSQTKKQR